MTKDIAANVTRELMNIAPHINALTELSDRLDSPAKGREMRVRLSAIMVAIDEIMRPIIRAYPELNPDKNSNWDTASRCKRKE